MIEIFSWREQKFVYNIVLKNFTKLYPPQAQVKQIENIILSISHNMPTMAQKYP